MLTFIFEGAHAPPMIAALPSRHTSIGHVDSRRDPIDKIQSDHLACGTRCFSHLDDGRGRRETFEVGPHRGYMKRCAYLEKLRSATLLRISLLDNKRYPFNPIMCSYDSYKQEQSLKRVFLVLGPVHSIFIFELTSLKLACLVVCLSNPSSLNPSLLHQTSSTD